jgi:quinolinate synthase
MDLFADIARLKKERHAVILAHYYQEPDIQDVADFIGDSLALARRAQKTDAEVIVLCGVHFMAETAKILNPSKKVVLPDLRAGCSLAESAPADRFRDFVARHPGHVVVSYVNTTAAVKALSDYVCTSSNAVELVKSIPRDTPIIFAPDVNLGRWVSRQAEREMVLWQGTCMVHETFNERRVLRLLEENPGAELIAHPECEPAVLAHAHYVGSTNKLLEYTTESAASAFIVATEAGILHAMQKASPSKRFIAAAPMDAKDPTCGCSTCPHMKLNTLEKVRDCLRDLSPEIVLDEELRRAALRPIERMVAVG